MNKQEHKENLFRSRNKILGFGIIYILLKIIVFFASFSGEYAFARILSAITEIVFIITIFFVIMIITNIIIYLENEDKTDSKVE